MPIHYTIKPSSLPTASEEPTYRAVPEASHTYSEQDMLEELTREGSILKETEVQAVLAAYWRQIGHYLAQGATYQDKYLRVSVGMKGTFTSEADRYDPERHQLTVKPRLQPAVTQGVQREKPRYVKPKVIRPELDDLHNLYDDTHNVGLTPGHVLKIRGRHLKLHGEHPGEGVFFRAAYEKAEYRATVVHTNVPKQLALNVPSLPPGSYFVEVRNTWRNGITLRNGHTTFAMVVKEGDP